MKKIEMKWLFSLLAVSLFFFNSCQRQVDINLKNKDNVLSKYSSDLVSNGFKMTYIDSIAYNLEELSNSRISISSSLSVIIFKKKSEHAGIYSFLTLICKEGKSSNVAFIDIKTDSYSTAIKSATQFLKNENVISNTVIEVFNSKGELIQKNVKRQDGKTELTIRAGVSPNKNTTKDENEMALSTLDQDPIGEAPICTDWYLLTFIDGILLSEEYVGTTCGPANSGGSGTYVEGSNSNADDGRLSCRSFNFTSMTTNMYEAGVRGLSFTVVAQYGPTYTFYFRDIFIGFPSRTADNRTFTSAEAAALTAQAMNRAALTMALQYQSYTIEQAAALTKSQFENQFKNLTSIILSNQINAGATVSFSRSGNNSITTNAIYNTGWEILWNGLSGNGCN